MNEPDPEKRLREAMVGRRFLEGDTRTGMVIVDQDGNISHINQFAREVLAPRAEPKGRKPIETIGCAELQEVVTLALSGEEFDPVECSLGRSYLSLSGGWLHDGSAMVVVRDVTADREAQRARTDFIANVSHELRTPVTAIMGYAETLLNDAERLEPDLLDMVRKVDRNARRLRDLFEDLLQLHRVEARQRELPLLRERLRPILEEAVIGGADQAAQRGLTFDLVCPADLYASCNAQALRTIVANLTANAVNYTEDGGRIAVRAHRDHGDKVVVAVSDNGIGIDPVHHQRIFERFYRVDAARSRRLGGTGLGLALVKHLALASRCRVSVDSKAGEGATFRIHLQAASG